MSDANSAAWVVREGQDVLASDGKKVGEVSGSAGSALIVKHGFLFTARELYIPASAIAAIDPQAVHLNVPFAEATSDAWNHLPDGAEVVPNVDASAPEPLPDATVPAPGDSWQIAEGMDVIGADGQHIGEVEDGTEESIVVRVGRFFPKSVVLSAAQIADVRGNAVHITATKETLGQGAPTSDTPLTDLQGRITNAWTGTQAELDPQAGAVDLGQPDPDLPIAPPPGDVPYTAPAPAAPEATTTDAADVSVEPAATDSHAGEPAAEPSGIPARSFEAAAFAFTSPVSHDATVATDADAPDETIDSASLAAEVPGLDLANAGIPALDEGGIVLAEEDNAGTANAASDTALSDMDAASPLSDAAAIGESPDPELAAEAAALAATEDYGDAGYTDLPSDPFEGDGDVPEDAEILAIATDEVDEEIDEPATHDLPVDLPGDLTPENVTAPAADSTEAPGFAPIDETPAAAPTSAAIEDTQAIPVAPAFAATASTFNATTATTTPSETVSSPLPAADTGASATAAPAAPVAEKEGFFGQLRNRISSLFDREETPATPDDQRTTTPPTQERVAETSAAVGAAAIGAAATRHEPVDIDATAPDVEVGATIPDVPDVPGGTAVSAVDTAAGRVAATADAPGREAAEPGFLEGVRERIDSLLDNPEHATHDATADTGIAAIDNDQVNAPVTDLPDADLHASQESAADKGEGFFHDLKERVDSFLDKPDEAQTPDRATIQDVAAETVVSDEETASIHAEDAPVVSEPEAAPVPAGEVLSDEELAAIYGEDAPLAIDVDPTFVAETEGAAGDASGDTTDEEPEEIAAEAFAQELYVSDPDINGSVTSLAAELEEDRPVEREVEAVPDSTLPLAAASATAAAAWQDEHRKDRGTSDSELAPDVEQRPSPDARTELAPDVEIPEAPGGEHEGFFDSLRDKVEHFLDNPEVAEPTADAETTAGIADTHLAGASTEVDPDFAAKAERDDTPEPLPSWHEAEDATTSGLDEPGAPESEPISADAFAAPADSTELLTSRFTVVSSDNDDDGDDLIASIRDDAGDETVSAPDLLASDVEVQGASDTFEALADPAALEDIDVEVNESAAVALEAPSVSEPDDTGDGQGEQAESDLFAAVVDATADTDIDAFGTTGEHHVEAEDAADLLSEDEDAIETAGLDGAVDAIEPADLLNEDVNAIEDEPSAAASAASFSPTTDDELLAELPPVDEPAPGHEEPARTFVADELSTHADPEILSAGEGTLGGDIAPANEDIPAAETAFIQAEEIEEAPDGPGDSGDLDLTDPDLDGSLDAGDETIAANAASGSLAGAADAAHDWVQGDEATGSSETGLTPPSFEPTPFTGDRTVAENAQSGTLANAKDVVAASTAQDSTIAGNALSGKLAGAGDLARGWTSKESASTEANAQATIAGATPTVEGATPLSAPASSAHDRGDTPASGSTRHALSGIEGSDWIAALEGGDAPNDWVVKGNANSGIYHTPESPSYEETIAEYWFPDAEAAERAGYRAPLNMSRAGEAAAHSTRHAAEAAAGGTASSTGAPFSAGAGSASSEDETLSSDAVSASKGTTLSSASGEDEDKGSGTHLGERSSTPTTTSEVSESGETPAKMYGPVDTEGTDWAAAVEGEDAPHGWLVKGNADSGIYHTPESSSYERTIAEVWFPDAEAAERAGYRAPRNMPKAGEEASDSARNAAAHAAEAASTDDEA